MSRWIWFIVALALINAILFFLVLRKPKNLSQDIARPEGVIEEPPDELEKDFDPTQNAPKFMVLEVNKDTETLKLKIVWPATLEGIEIGSKIYCREGDIKINGSDASTSNLFSKIQSMESGSMIFSGICSDTNCSEIVKSCELYYDK